MNLDSIRVNTKEISIIQNKIEIYIITIENIIAQGHALEATSILIIAKVIENVAVQGDTMRVTGVLAMVIVLNFLD